MVEIGVGDGDRGDGDGIVRGYEIVSDAKRDTK